MPEEQHQDAQPMLATSAEVPQDSVGPTASPQAPTNQMPVQQTPEPIREPTSRLVSWSQNYAISIVLFAIVMAANIFIAAVSLHAIRSAGSQLGPSAVPLYLIFFISPLILGIPVAVLITWAGSRTFKFKNGTLSSALFNAGGVPWIIIFIGGLLARLFSFGGIETATAKIIIGLFYLIAIVVGVTLFKRVYGTSWINAVVFPILFGVLSGIIISILSVFVVGTVAAL